MNIKYKDYCLLTIEEHDEILKIRNLPLVRLGSNDSSSICLDDHLTWVKELKGDDSRKFYAVIVDNQILGGINLFSIGKSSAQWGVFFKEKINPFVTSFAACHLLDRAFKEFNLEKMNLEVNKKNTNAFGFDLNLGFVIYGEKVTGTEEYHLMSLTRDIWSDAKSSRSLSIIYKRAQSATYKFLENE